MSFYSARNRSRTLRLNQKARAELLEDFKRQPRSTDPVARQWEKWLKGADPDAVGHIRPGNSLRGSPVPFT